MRQTLNSAYAAAAFCLATLCMLASGAALAERADRDKPVNLEADSMTADEARKIATFDGKVVMTQGSLIIRADRIVVRQDENGFQRGIATGSPATFRNKREGYSEYIDAEAQRIEYDSKLGRVEFFNGARLRRDSGDDVRGDYISYDASTERFTVKARDGAPGASPDGRVRATIMPKKAVPRGQPPSGADPKD